MSNLSWLWLGGPLDPKKVANHVFLLDPWWNPACEMQAIQRAHRIGQTRPVKADLSVELWCFKMEQHNKN